MLVWSIAPLQGMEERSHQHVVARLIQRSDMMRGQDFVLNHSNEDALYNIPHITNFCDNTLDFYLYHTLQHDTITTTSTNQALGTLEDFRKTTTQKHEKKRTALLHRILSIQDPFVALETLSILANILIKQKCADSVIEPLYWHIHKLHQKNIHHFAKENQIRASMLNFLALHNNIIIYFNSHIDIDVTIFKNFIHFFEYLGTLPEYPAQEKAQKDAAMLYMYIADVSDQHQNHAQAYEYYKKASRQTIIPEINFEATAQLLEYTWDKDVITKRPRDEVDAFGCIFEDADLPECKCSKY